MSKEVSRKFEIAREFEVDARPEEVWEAITTGTGGYLWPMEPPEPRVGGKGPFGSKVIAWDPPHRFIDQQVRGPYALWHHTHDLEPLGDDRTLMRDTVRYAIGFGPLGELARRLLVERDLKEIFDYRAERVAEIASTMRLTPGSSPGLSATYDQSTVRSGPTSTSARSENPAGSK